MRRYFKRDITKEWLLKNDFRYNRYFSNKDDTVYTNRFMVAKQEGKHTTSLECEMLVYYPEGNISINVYFAGTRDKYPQFYDRKYGKDNRLLDMIDLKIFNKMKQLGIEVKKDDRNDNN